MARIDVLLPFILSWEGGFCNVPGDRGGATNKGVTLKTWKSQGYDKDGDGDTDTDDLRLITEGDVRDVVLKPHYWDRCRADEIRCQAVANLLVDWVWCSGRHGIVKVQEILGVEADGIVGKKTVGAVNGFGDQSSLFKKLWTCRDAFLAGIVRNTPSQAKFLRGWQNRLCSIKWNSLTYNNKIHTFT